MAKTFKIKQQYKSFVFLINGKINEYICLASIASLYVHCLQEFRNTRNYDQERGRYYIGYDIPPAIIISGRDELDQLKKITFYLINLGDAFIEF